MATEALIIRVDETGARVVSGRIGGIGRQSKKAASEVGFLQKALRFVSAGIILRQFTSLSDEFLRLQNRVRIATDGQAGYNRNLDELFAIANRTRGPVEELVALYQRGSIAANQLGASQGELLKFTETIGQALAIQGGAAESARGALIQLSQTLGQDIVRAEEFNAILEGAFPIALAAAKGIERMGGSVAVLRREIINGKVSSQEFFRGILSQSQELERQFGLTLPTIGQAFTQLRNQMVQTIGRFNESTGASQIFVTAIQQLTEYVRNFTPQMILIGKAVQGTLQPTDELTDGARLLAATFILVGSAAQILARSLYDTLGVAFRSVGGFIGGLIASIEQLVKGNFSGAKVAIQEAIGDISGDISKTFRDLNGELLSQATETFDKLQELFDKRSRSVRLEPITVNYTLLSTGGEAPKINQDLLDDLNKYVKKLQQQRDELQFLSDDYKTVEDAVARYRTELEVGTLGQTEAAKTARQLTEEIIRLNHATSNQEVIRNLQQQANLIGLTNRERAIETELRKLSTDATEEQKNQVRALAGELYDVQLLTQLQQTTLDELFRNTVRSAHSLLAGALADPLGEGLDELPKKFRELLAQLSAELLTSALFRALLTFATGGTGGFSNFLGHVLGFGTGVSLPAAANGLDFMVGGSGGTDSKLAQFLVTPGERVTVQTPAQQRQSNRESKGDTFIFQAGLPAEIRALVENTAAQVAASTAVATIKRYTR